MVIEFLRGKEYHYLSWSKFYIKGLEAYEVQKEFENNCKRKDEFYQGFCCSNVPLGTIFYVFDQHAYSNKAPVFRMLVCVASKEKNLRNASAEQGQGFLRGNYQIISEAKTRLKAPCMLNWWNDADDNSLEFSNKSEFLIEQ